MRLRIFCVTATAWTAFFVCVAQRGSVAGEGDPIRCRGQVAQLAGLEEQLAETAAQRQALSKQVDALTATVAEERQLLSVSEAQLRYAAVRLCQRCIDPRTN